MLPWRAGVGTGFPGRSIGWAGLQLAIVGMFDQPPGGATWRISFCTKKRLCGLYEEVPVRFAFSKILPVSLSLTHTHNPPPPHPTHTHPHTL